MTIRCSVRLDGGDQISDVISFSGGYLAKTQMKIDGG
jgi:hypothetical protein